MITQEDLASNCNYKWSLKIVLPPLCSNLILITGMILHSKTLIEKPSLSGDAVFAISVTITDILSFLATIGLMSFLLVCNIILKKTVENLQEAKVVTLEHLEELKRIVEVMRNALETPACVIISNQQILVVIVIFLSLLGYPTPILFAIGIKHFIYN